MDCHAARSWRSRAAATTTTSPRARTATATTCSSTVRGGWWCRSSDRVGLAAAVEHVAVASRLLGEVHAAVGEGHQLVRIADGVAAILGDADAEGHPAAVGQLAEPFRAHPQD